jgi:cell division protein FtsA
MDTRVGYPNEHLAGDSDSDITSPLYATAVGLVLDGLQRQDKQQPVAESSPNTGKESTETTKDPPPVRSKGFLEKLTERVKEFLENAE